MDTGFLMLLTAVAGYLLILKLAHTCHRRPRWSGYHLLFLSFAAGFFLLLPALTGVKKRTHPTPQNKVFLRSGGAQDASQCGRAQKFDVLFPSGYDGIIGCRHSFSEEAAS